MNRARTEIINYLAEHTTEEEYQFLVILERYSNIEKPLDLAFDVLREYNSVKDDLEQITEYLASTSTTKYEVIRCLEFLSKKILDHRMGENKSKPSQYYYDLIKVTWYKRWAESQQQYFDHAYALLDRILHDWQDYFFSYTNKNAYSTYKRYRKLVKEYVKPNERKKKKRERINLLAMVIVNRFEAEGLFGFYDVDKIRSGQELSPDIEKYCRETFAFVQLIQKEIFRKYEADKQHWCFEEYSTFLGHHRTTPLPHPTHPPRIAERFHFLIAGNNLRGETPAQMPPYCTDWHQHMERVRHIVLPRGIDRDTLESRVAEVATQIIDLRKRWHAQIIEGVPE